MSSTIAFELEKTLHLMKSRILGVFRENKFPVSKDQWLILERIAKNEGSNQKNIARDTFKDPAALTRILDILVDKNFVKRQASAEDRRTFDIHLTVEGNRLVNRMTPILDKVNSEIQNAISIDDKKLLQTILQKLQTIS